MIERLSFHDFVFSQTLLVEQTLASMLHERSLATLYVHLIFTSPVHDADSNNTSTDDRIIIPQGIKVKDFTSGLCMYALLIQQSLYFQFHC